MKRRTFVKGMLGTGLAAGSCVFRDPLISTAAAQIAALPTLVVVFQRGGCDGLNMVVPFGDSSYYDLRPTIGIPEPDPTDPTSALLLDDPFNTQDDFFGLHPSLAPLMPIYDAGNMAVLPTVQYPSSSHSHFDSQHFIESGEPVKTIDGWLNRHLQLANGNGQLRAVHFGSELSQALRGTVPVQSFSFIDSFNLGLNSTDEADLINSVLPVYNDTPASPTPYQALVHQYGQVLFGNLNVVSNIDTGSYQPANGAVYPNGSYGRQLKETAQLIKEGVGLEVATVNIGGWDTHSDQGDGDPNGRQARRFGELSSGVGALYTDLGSMMDNVVILIMTEFGRTAKENGSGGTDHGDGCCWVAIGNNVNGGIYGDWPGLGDSELARGRYLKFTLDYRDIMGDILVNHLGHAAPDLTTLLPNHSYSTLNLI